MPRPPRSSRPSRVSRPGHAGRVGLDRGIIRKPWKQHLVQMAEVRAVSGERPTPPPPKLSKFWSVFEIWRPTPAELAERRRAYQRASLADVIVPEREQRYVERAREDWRRGVRPEQAPTHRPAEQAPPRPRQASIPEVTPAYVDQVLNLEKVFAHTKEIRRDPKWAGVAGIGIVSPAGMDSWGKALRTAAFFGIPEAELSRVNRDQVWGRLLEPFLKDVAATINAAKPREIQGTYRFETSPSGAFGLVYAER